MTQTRHALTALTAAGLIAAAPAMASKVTDAAPLPDISAPEIADTGGFSFFGTDLLDPIKTLAAEVWPFATAADKPVAAMPGPALVPGVEEDAQKF